MQKHSFIRDTQGYVSSYDYYDLASLTAYKNFYGVGTNEGYFLSPEAIGSNENDKMTQIAAGPELNFDALFNVPKRIGGKAFIGVTNFLLGGGTPPATGNIKVKVYHVRGVTETAISSQITSDTFSANGEQDYRFSIELDITPTNFKKGDILRLEIIGAGSNGGAGGQTAITHDALNNILTTTAHVFINSTSLDFMVPFKII